MISDVKVLGVAQAVENLKEMGNRVVKGVTRKSVRAAIRLVADVVKKNTYTANRQRRTGLLQSAQAVNVSTKRDAVIGKLVMRRVDVTGRGKVAKSVRSKYASRKGGAPKTSSAFYWKFLEKGTGERVTKRGADRGSVSKRAWIEPAFDANDDAAVEAFSKVFNEETEKAAQSLPQPKEQTMKQSSQGTQFFVQSGVIPFDDVASATKAAPSVFTLTTNDPTIVVGSVVIPVLWLWPSVDDKPFIIDAVLGSTRTMANSDTSNEPGTLGPGAGIRVATMTEACMATITFTSPAGAVIDVTTLCDTARQTLPGLPAVSTWQATGFWDAEDPMQKALRDLYRAGKNSAFKVVFPDGSGFLFIGGVNQFDIRVGVDQAVQWTVGGNVSGPAMDLPPTAMTAAAAIPPPASQPQPPAEPEQAVAA